MIKPLPSNIRVAATELANRLLNEDSWNEISEASVHRPARSEIWQAAFTSASGGQRWKSTGLRDRNRALQLARRWEAEARAERERLGRVSRKPVLRVRHSGSGMSIGLTQREVAQVLKISERAVREIERRALRKLLNHPTLRQIWQDYLSGTLEERDSRLTRVEIEALFALARDQEEYRVIEKALLLIQG